MQCHACERTDDDSRLERCSVCHRYFCEDHFAVMSGRRFCSERCAQFFFFGDSDSEED